MPVPDSAGPRHPPVTVVIAQRIRPGREPAFRHWQDEVDAAAASFSGFLGTEVGLSPGSESEWSVVYRFDCADNLRHWLDSETRRALMIRGGEFFEGAPTQYVLIDEGHDDAVTVAVSHPPVPGREAEFLAWQRRVADAERAFPGFRGSEMHRPVPGIQEDWIILFTFDSSENLDRWLTSPERAVLLEEGREFRDFKVQRIANPYGSWFPAPGAGAAPTASWKTALSVLMGLYPTVVVLTILIAEVWPGAPLWVSLLVGNVLSVSILTWVVMPVVTRVLGFWLEPDDPHDRRTERLGVAISVGFLAVAAIVFWLVTRVFWTLP
ncbi:antibiotic biosynthesis monooxygenase [Rhodococcus sp. NPDC127528]|uniref:antibiotic biosynthesis monooxygenase n=1 Tax=unclassified Rhodococcus (in: high G+C Gram-positive bacteria) TaxID=192944 RepID=UPI00362E2D77